MSHIIRIVKVLYTVNRSVDNIPNHSTESKNVKEQLLLFSFFHGCILILHIADIKICPAPYIQIKLGRY
jgi:hypothetical protein